MDNINFAKLTPAQKVLLAKIRHSLATNPKAVEKAITVLFANQTTDEQVESTTKYTNRKGFSAADAKRGTRFARWVRSGRNLSGWHLDKARALVGKYWRQLLRAALAKAEGARSAAVKSTVEPPVGSWASIARVMAAGDNSGTDWDAWKGEMKESMAS